MKYNWKLKMKPLKKPIYSAIVHKVLSCLILFFLFPITGNSQIPMTFSHINYKQGLSNSTVECITQDRRGFMWIGTRDGLNKYDGYNIRSYKRDNSSKHGLSDSYIKSLFVDEENILWIGTRNGFNRFDEKTQLFRSWHKQSDKQNTLSANQINGIIEDKKHRLWLGTERGLVMFNKQTETFHQTPIKSDITAIAKSSSGKILAGGSAGFFIINPDNGQIQSFLERKYPRILSITEEKANLFWLATEGAGLILFDTVTKKERSYTHNDHISQSLGSNMVLCLLKTKQGKIYAGTINGGLNILQHDQQGFDILKDEADNTTSLSQRTISALFQDSQGNLWVGTHRGGLNLYAKGSSKFEHYAQGTKAHTLSHNDVKCFLEDSSNQLWIGTDGGGLNRYTPETKQFNSWRHNQNDINSLGSDAVLDIMEDHRHRLWVSTWGGGLNLMNSQNHTFITLKHDAKDTRSISSDFVQFAFEDANKTIWIGTYFGGLNILDPETRTFKRVSKSRNGQSSLLGNNIISITQDKNNDIWIGTDDGGLNRYNPTRDVFTHYFHKSSRHPDIRVIFCDSKNNIWLGQEGLWKLNRKTNTFSEIGNIAELKNAFIKGIEEDAKGRLWITTAESLICLTPDSLKIRTFNNSDGLDAMEFEANSSYKTKSGMMFFGGLNGFNCFFPAQITNNQFIPPVFITKLEIFNKEITPLSEDSPLRTDISYTNTVSLNHNQSSITLGFTALNFLSSDNNHYAYMLEGFDSDWTEGKNIKSATYTNLDPGNYTFRVKASNNDGIWNEKGIALKITISPPWWETWWFRGLILLSLSSLFYIIHIYRKNQHIHRLNELKKEEIHQLQLQFFTNISHEFRTPLALIMGMLEKLINEGQNTGLLKIYRGAYKNAQRLLLLINELMDFRKVESGSLKLKTASGDIALFVKEICEEFNEWADQKKLSFEIIVPKYSGAPTYFDRQILEKILLNLINNSFKYTPEHGKISVKVFFDKNEFKPTFQNSIGIESGYHSKRSFYIMVADTGIGISGESIEHLFQRYYRITSSHLGSGIGLAFVKTLTNLHKGDIFAYSERNKGTEILIAIPCSETDYTSNEQWTADENRLVLESILPSFETLELPLFEEKHEKDIIPQPLLDKKILIVEDNSELQEFLRSSLAPYYNILLATNGVEGFQTAKTNNPDLIISDIMMPQMNGIELCKAVRNTEQLKHIPFILLTAKATIESQLEGIESGADYYFPKPLSISLLILTLKNIFTQRQQNDERNLHRYLSEIKTSAINEKDQEFLNELSRVIHAHLENPNMDVDFLCEQLNMSRTKIYEGLKRINGQSIVEFVRTLRLNKAAYIMIHEDIPLTEVMYRVGIQTQSHFSKAFKKEFGKSPSEYIRELGNNNKK